MTPFNRYCLITAAVMAAAGSAHAATLTSAGYSENFDEMGATGTALPASWTVYDASGANTAWTNTTGIPASGTTSVASMVAGSSTLAGALSTIPANTKNGTSAYNVATNIADPNAASTDRSLATSPTVVAGTALQLALTNNTGSALTSINISYDIDRFTQVSTANELPGYELFYSTNGTTWTNVSDLNPTLAGGVNADGSLIPAVPNTVGVTTVSGTFNLASAVANGSTLELRWVDDDANQTSPDQMIGLNNVGIAPVPLPAGLPLLASALGALGLFGRRSKRAAA